MLDARGAGRRPRRHADAGGEPEQTSPPAGQAVARRRAGENLRWAAAEAVQAVGGKGVIGRVGWPRQVAVGSPDPRRAGWRCRPRCSIRS